MNFEQLQQIEDRKPLKVPMKEWGIDVWVRPLSAGDVLEWQAAARTKVTVVDGKPEFHMDKNADAKLEALLVAMGMCNESGAPLTSDRDALVAVITSKSHKPVNKLFTIIARISGIHEGSVEELIKN
jgi:hypothetical protein